MSDSIDRIYERVLVLRCQTGDWAGIEDIVRRYHTRLRRFVRRMLDDEHATEDLLQEIWFDVFRGIGKVRDLGAFQAWLFRIARDRVYRLLRRKGFTMQSIHEIDIAGPETTEE